MKCICDETTGVVCMSHRLAQAEARAEYWLDTRQRLANALVGLGVFGLLVGSVVLAVDIVYRCDGDYMTCNLTYGPELRGTVK
jgi:hypothetical protein